MKKAKVFSLLASLPALCCLTAAALAQAPAPPGPSAKPSQPLTDQQVLDCLRKTATKVFRVSQPGAKVPVYQLDYRQNGWSYRIEVALTEKVVQLYCPLGRPIAGPQALPQELRQRIQAMDKKIPHTYFRFVEGTGQLCLLLKINRPVTAQGLQVGLEEFLRDFRDSFPVWSDYVRLQEKAPQ